MNTSTWHGNSQLATQRIYAIKQERWDAELDRDASSGKLDFLIAEAHEDRKQGRLKNWPDPE